MRRVLHPALKEEDPLFFWQKTIKAIIKSWNLNDRCTFRNTQKLSSDKKLNEENASVHFDANPRIVQDERCFPLNCENTLFYLLLECLHEQSIAATTSFQLRHERLAHNNKIDFRNLANVVVDMKKVDEGNEPCDVCNTEKTKRLPISRQVATTRAKKLLDIVHVDISPVNTRSIDDFKYALEFVDSFSRLGAVHLLRTRTEVGPKLLKYIVELGKSRKIVTDKAKEFKFGSFADICLQQAIHQEFTCEYTPEQNGQIKQVWGNIGSMAWCLLKQQAYLNLFDRLHTEQLST